MIALSVRQPWAWMIVHDWKPVENRSWATRFRGRFLVHAAKGITRREYDEACALARAIRGNLDGLPPFDDIERGGFVGSVELVDCVTDHPSSYFFGPYGFVLRDAETFPFRAYRGQLGFFEVSP